MKGVWVAPEGCGLSFVYISKMTRIDDTVDGCEILHQVVDGLSHCNPIIDSVYSSQ